MNNSVWRRPIVWFLLAAAVFWAVKYASESEMRRLDKEVDRLCAIDGGSFIYEVARLPDVKFNEHGQPRLPVGADETGFGYFDRGTTQLLSGPYDHLQGASLKRYETQIVRTSDGKVLAKRVVYNRSGGDWLRQFFMVGPDSSPVSAKLTP
jgi:hypothetical protein